MPPPVLVVIWTLSVIQENSPASAMTLSPGASSTSSTGSTEPFTVCCTGSSFVETGGAQGNGGRLPVLVTGGRRANPRRRLLGEEDRGLPAGDRGAHGSARAIEGHERAALLGRTGLDLRGGEHRGRTELGGRSEDAQLTPRARGGLRRVG